MSKALSWSSKSNSVVYLTFVALSSVHTELLATTMQKLVENFFKDWVEYPSPALLANANSIANAQCERTLTDFNNTNALFDRPWLDNDYIGINIFFKLTPSITAW